MRKETLHSIDKLVNTKIRYRVTYFAAKTENWETVIFRVHKLRTLFEEDMFCPSLDVYIIICLLRNRFRRLIYRSRTHFRSNLNVERAGA